LQLDIISLLIISTWICRFKQLKAEENKKKLNKALPSEEVEVLASTSDSEDISDGESKVCCLSYIQFSWLSVPSS